LAVKFFRAVSPDHPLLRAVASWPGRGPTQLAFEALGFSIHRARQNRIIQFCGDQQSDLLNRYWDEVATETMQSLGQGDPDERAFAIQPAYRSAFLDELFAARDFVELPFRYPPLVKCVFEYIKRIYLDREFRESEATFFRSLQNLESERLGIQTTGWSGKKRDVVPFVEQFCTALAFERHRNRWRKKTNGGLIFEVGVFLGGNPYCVGWPPLIFRIFHKDDRKFAFHTEGASVLNRLVPGVDDYARCGKASDYVLGIKALIELFDVIARSFDQSSATQAS
jgi:hypothetical protein